MTKPMTDAEQAAAMLEEVFNTDDWLDGDKCEGCPLFRRESDQSEAWGQVACTTSIHCDADSYRDCVRIESAINEAMAPKKGG